MSYGCRLRAHDESMIDRDRPGGGREIRGMSRDFRRQVCRELIRGNGGTVSRGAEKPARRDASVILDRDAMPAGGNRLPAIPSVGVKYLRAVASRSSGNCSMHLCIIRASGREAAPLLEREGSSRRLALVTRGLRCSLTRRDTARRSDHASRGSGTIGDLHRLISCRTLIESRNGRYVRYVRDYRPNSRFMDRETGSRVVKSYPYRVNRSHRLVKVTPKSISTLSLSLSLSFSGAGSPSSTIPRKFPFPASRSSFSSLFRSF